MKTLFYVLLLAYAAWRVVVRMLEDYTLRFAMRRYEGMHFYYRGKCWVK